MTAYPQPGDLALTLWQPYASLCATPDPDNPEQPVKPVENRPWPVPSTLPQWFICERCGERRYRGTAKAQRPDCANPLPLRKTIKNCWTGEDDGPFPFRLWIHAAKRDTDGDRSIPTAAWDALGRIIGGAAPPRGVLLAPVQVTGCHPWLDCIAGTAPQGAQGCSPWAEDDPYHWTLTDPQPLAEPIPMRGRQRLWRITADDLTAVPA